MSRWCPVRCGLGPECRCTVIRDRNAGSEFPGDPTMNRGMSQCTGSRRCTCAHEPHAGCSGARLRVCSPHTGRQSAQRMPSTQMSTATTVCNDPRPRPSLPSECQADSESGGERERCAAAASAKGDGSSTHDAWRSIAWPRAALLAASPLCIAGAMAFASTSNAPAADTQVSAYGLHSLYKLDNREPG